MDDHALSERAGAPPPSGLDEAREHYLLLLLARFESGELESSEYFRRVHQVQLAGSVAAMEGVVDTPAAPEPALDPVDMLLLSRPMPKKTPGGSRPRWWWMAVMAFFFVVLLLVGLWLVAHIRQLRNSGNLGTVAAVSAVSATPVSAP
ncbi:MAG TPA: hypothetical protein VEJ21_04525 [Acidimicrobiales bacterium]|nr:hypothetical protein [Acidimicrobiales bacterium]